LATATGLELKQVSNWFINARKRLWQPALLEQGEDIRSHLSNGKGRLATNEYVDDEPEMDGESAESAGDEDLLEDTKVNLMNDDRADDAKNTEENREQIIKLHRKTHGSHDTTDLNNSKNTCELQNDIFEINITDLNSQYFEFADPSVLAGPITEHHQTSPIPTQALPNALSEYSTLEWSPGTMAGFQLNLRMDLFQ
jgi:hypothetical protein